VVTRLIYGAEVLSMNELLEVHVTVQVASDIEEEQFRSVCVNDLEGKCVAIQLPSGAAHSRQPMLSYYHRGNIMDCLVEMYEKYASRIRHEGFKITRLKIELQMSKVAVVSPNIPIPPTTDAQSQAFPSNYFEFHIKLQLPKDRVEEQQAVMKRIGQTHHAHVSRNAFKKDSAGNVIWFMTMRMYGMAMASAFEMFELCVEDVRNSGLDIVSMQREYAVYDSNVGLDKGWIDLPIPTTPGGYTTQPELKQSS
jgi:hypothetical protein